MQAIMWGILLCTIGVAAVASQLKRGASSVKLGEPQLLDSVTVRLPRGWPITDEGKDAIAAIEGDQGDSRTVLVRERDPNDGSLLSWISGANGPAKRSAKSTTIRMGPTEGVITVTRKPIELMGRRTRYRDLEITASSTLPNGHILTISVNCYDLEGSNEDAAMEVLKLVAGSVEYIPANALQTGDKK
jgi:hypothetical protein